MFINLNVYPENSLKASSNHCTELAINQLQCNTKNDYLAISLDVLFIGKEVKYLQKNYLALRSENFIHTPFDYDFLFGTLKQTPLASIELMRRMETFSGKMPYRKRWRKQKSHSKLYQGKKPPHGFQYINCHVVFDIKMEDFQRKACLVA